MNICKLAASYVLGPDDPEGTGLITRISINGLISELLDETVKHHDCVPETCDPSGAPLGRLASIEVSDPLPMGDGRNMIQIRMRFKD